MLDLFIKFLIAHNVLEEYYNNTKHYCIQLSVKWPPEDFIIEAFGWRRYPNINWQELHREWINICNQNDHSDIEYNFATVLRRIEKYKQEKQSNIISIF